MVLIVVLQTGPSRQEEHHVYHESSMRHAQRQLSFFEATFFNLHFFIFLSLWYAVLHLILFYLLVSDEKGEEITMGQPAGGLK